jgi:DNA gyrase subunit B
VKITLEDNRGAELQRSDLFYEGGVREFVKYLDRSKAAMLPEPIHIMGERAGIGVEVAMWWNDSYHETVLPFTNNIPQRDGGTHMQGFRAALTRTLTKYAQDSGIAKREKIDFTGDDAREGLTCVLSVKVPDPKFSSQTKDKLVSSEVRPAVEEPRGREAGLLVSRRTRATPASSPARSSRRRSPARPRARRASSPAARRHGRQLPRRQAQGLLEKDPSKTEVFLVEGDSAGGSAQTGRDRRTQAVLPLRGKILNVERARFDRMLAPGDRQPRHGARHRHRPRRVQPRQAALRQDRHHDGRRRGRRAHPHAPADLLLPPDAPADRGGHLFIAQPPLYKVARGKSEVYLMDQARSTTTSWARGQTARHPAPGRRGEMAGADLMRVGRRMRGPSREPRRPTAPPSPATSVEQAVIAGAFRAGGGVYLGPPGLVARRWRGASTLMRALDTSGAALGRDHPDKGIRLSRVLRRRGGSCAPSSAPSCARRKPADWGPRITDRAAGGLRDPRDAGAQRTAQTIMGPLDLLRAILAEGEKGLTLQRYKGLGEMNPEQLWETTLDPEARTLLQVRVDDIADAEDIFSRLMGETVEPRREFIQANALNVAHLDA